MQRLWMVFLLSATLFLGGCSMSGEQPAPTETPRPQYLLEQDGTVKLRLSTLLENDMLVRLKCDDNEVELDAEGARELLRAVDNCIYGTKPQPMPTDAKGYLWAVRASLQSTDESLFFYFLDMETRATIVVINDGTQRTLSMDAATGRALAETFADIARRKDMGGETTP